ncbi:GNAT family N-acetyltransferase, partial [Candidatus Pelagibacter sp.]|nr:GNAT family N-acetyltransferase [Candidatus Pelagibacter sp.]
KKNYQNKKVGTSLINYVNNKYLKKNEKIKAGTQLNNLNANIVYKKIGFKQLKTFKYVYHIHSKN